jgi:hypothetical protein
LDSCEGSWNGIALVYTILKCHDPGIQYERQWLQLPILSSHVLCEDASRTYTDAMQSYHRLIKEMTEFAGHLEYLQRVFLHQMQAYARKMPKLGEGNEPSKREDEAVVMLS